jgi:trimeric autotransporter adhesin
MAVSIANVNPSTDSFQNWLDKTNLALDKLSTIVVTAAANTTGDVTTGNVVISDNLSANTLVARTSLRGGNVSSSGNLSITSNATFTANHVVTGVTSRSNVSNFIVGATNTYINSVATSITGNTLTITSTTTDIKNKALFINTSGQLNINTDIGGEALTVVGNANISGNVVVGGQLILNGVAAGADLTVGGNLSVNSVSTLTGNVVVQSRMSVNGAVTLANTLSVTGTSNLSVTNISGHTNVAANVMVALAASPNTGYLYLGTSGTKGLFFNGVQYSLPGANLIINGNRALTNADFGVYSSSGVRLGP